MIWHMGVAASHPCHACDVKKQQQCEIARTDTDIGEVMRDYKSLIIDILHGCHLRHNLNKPKAARELQTKTGFYNTYLPPSLWSKFFDPIKQTPPCLMHNGPLGLIRTMILQFSDIYEKTFVEHVNDAVANNPRFPGVLGARHGIFCESSCIEKIRRRYTLRKLNADQLMGFARSSPAFIWKVLSKTHFDLWVLILRWFSILYAPGFNRNSLDCTGVDTLKCSDDQQCLRHMGRNVVTQWLSVFGHPDLESYRFSTTFWNLHVQLHMFQYIQQLGPLYLLATDIGESHHAVQKRFGVMTNHQHNSMESQILKKNHICMAWRFYNGRHSTSAALTTSSSVNDGYSLHSPKSSWLQITGVLVDVLYNVVTNTWAPDIDKMNLPSEGAIFSKMKLNGHFIGCGDNVAVAHNEASDIPWFAKIERFVRFHHVNFY